MYGKCECFVMQMLYVCVLCASYGLFLMLVEDARGDHMEGILQSRFYDFLIGSHECLLLFSPSCCGQCFYHL